jgi:hypothetical protein
MIVKPEEVKDLRVKLTPNRATCGGPTLSMEEKHKFTAEIEGIEGHQRFIHIDYCPECSKVNGFGSRTKRCIKCDEYFTPGCKVRFTCITCYNTNKEKDENSL